MLELLDYLRANGFKTYISTGAFEALTRVLAPVGNSDGDLGMMAYTADRKGPSLAILIDHDDAAREYRYIAGAERAVAQASQRGWVRVSMRRDWRTVYPAAR